MGRRGLIRNADAVAAYQEEAARKSDFERTELNKEKTGVVVEGVKGINPVNGKEIPIFISDYVLATYGTGAIMAVPAHDTRDWEFAKKFGLPIMRSSRALCQRPRQGGLHRRGHRHARQLRLPERPVR